MRKLVSAAVDANADEAGKASQDTLSTKLDPLKITEKGLTRDRRLKDLDFVDY